MPNLCQYINPHLARTALIIYTIVTADFSVTQSRRVWKLHCEQEGFMQEYD